MILLAGLCTALTGAMIGSLTGDEGKKGSEIAALAGI